MKKLPDTNCVKIPELLAPAGSLKTCKAVIHAGADAVYLGGSQFGARAYANNFTKEELFAAIDYAHLHGCKIYLTVNTLLKQPEIDILYDYLLPYYEYGLDAVIVQDFGVMRDIHTYFPELAIHISTQMSVCSIYGAAYLKKLGAVRIVPARELSLEEIRFIRSQLNIELECFVHGALCYSYSGQCLFSSMLGGRSGNRGRCAQPCRLPYTVWDDSKHRLSEKESYPLSLKDLSTIEQLPQLIEAGIDSFKIEGRMKSAEYAAGVTAIYRKYIDLYRKLLPNDRNCQNNSAKNFKTKKSKENNHNRIQKKDKESLLDTGSRCGFTSGYYVQHNGAEMVTLTRPGHEKHQGAYLQWVHEQYIQKEPKLPLSAKACFKIGERALLSVSCNDISVSVSNGIIEAAQKQPLTQEMAAAQLSKTGNTPFQIEELDIEMDDSIFMTKQALNQLRRQALDALTSQMLLPYRRTGTELLKECCKQEECYKQENLCSQKELYSKHKIPSESCFTAYIENSDQLFAVLEQDFIARIYLDSSMYKHKQFAAQLKEQIRCIKTAGKEAYFVLPTIFRQKTAQFYEYQWETMEQAGLDGYLVRNEDELGFLEKKQIEKERCVLDHHLYTCSDTTKAAYAALGWNYDTIPLELNKKELLTRNNTQSELIIYGYLPLMTSAQCLYQTFGQCKKVQRLSYLKDRYAKEFPVKNNCNECYNTIYNSRPLSLLQLAGELSALHTLAYRLHFTIEPEEKVRRILNCCKQSLIEHRLLPADKITNLIGEYTNGHYKRGVE